MLNINNEVIKLDSEQYLNRDINLFLELPFWLTSLCVSCDETSSVKLLLNSKKFWSNNNLYCNFLPIFERLMQLINTKIIRTVSSKNDI